MLADDATEVPLPDEAGRRREYLGVSLKDIAVVAGGRDKLALLLTSGASKGGPLAVIARAGYANSIVCDQAAAKAALEELAKAAPDAAAPAPPPGNR
jgi:hypothetical protein